MLNEAKLVATKADTWLLSEGATSLLYLWHFAIYIRVVKKHSFCAAAAATGGGGGRAVYIRRLQFGARPEIHSESGRLVRRFLAQRRKASGRRKPPGSKRASSPGPAPIESFRAVPGSASRLRLGPGLARGLGGGSSPPSWGRAREGASRRRRQKEPRRETAGGPRSLPLGSPPR